MFRHVRGFSAAISLSAVCLAFSVTASEPMTEHVRKLGNSKPTSVKIEELRWLAGTWRGTGLGGEVEEIWSEPQNGMMMGMFRFMQKGEWQMLELMTLQEKDGAISLKVKHFSPEMVAWEEKEKLVEFPWIEKDDKGFYFEGLTFIPEPNHLVIYVATKGKEGKIDEMRFDFERVSTPTK